MPGAAFPENILHPLPSPPAMSAKDQIDPGQRQMKKSSAAKVTCPFHARYKAMQAKQMASVSAQQPLHNERSDDRADSGNGASSPSSAASRPAAALSRPPMLRHVVKSYSIDQPDAALTVHSPSQQQIRREHVDFFQQQQLRKQSQRLRKNALAIATTHTAHSITPPHADAASASSCVAGVDQSQDSDDIMPVPLAEPLLPHEATLDKLAAARGANHAPAPPRHASIALTTPLALAPNPRSFPYLSAAAGGRNLPSPTSTVTAAHQYPTVSSMFPTGSLSDIDAAAYEAVRISDVGDGYVYLNQYKLSNETLGHGTYSIVKLAYNTEDNTHYAMKILSKKKLMKKHRMSRKVGDPMQEAYREIAILKKLNHPNIIRLTEVLDDPNNDSLYMVFELLERGEVLVVPTENPLSEIIAWRYFRDFVLGVEYLHYNGILHRDLKPSNLLLDDSDHLKIADFGLSHMFEGRDVLLSGTVGTPAFHAPEILSLAPTGNALRQDAKTGVSGLAMDVWSMGITLYSLVFGDVPFRDESVVGLHHQIKSFPPVFPANVVISDALQDLISRLLDKDPERRLTITEMRDHPWITRHGTEPLLPSYADNCQAPISVTEEDIQASVRSIPHLDTLILIKAMLKRGSFHHPFKGDLWDTRKGSLDSNFPPAPPPGQT